MNRRPFLRCVPRLRAGVPAGGPGRAAARALLAAMLCLGLSSGPAPAAGPDPAEAVSAALLPGWRDASGRHVAGLRLRLAPGWKTYWRSAGSAGISPRFDWRASDGIAAVDPLWPAPTFFEGPAGRAFGYGGEVVIPLAIAVTGPDAVLRGEVEIGVCRDICVPARLRLEASLPERGQRDAAIAGWMARGAERVETRADCRFEPARAGLGLTATMDVPSPGQPETVVFEVEDPTVWVTDSEVHRQGGRITARTRLIGPGGGPPSMVRRGGIRITLLGGSRAVELAGCDGS